jgi:hypothetical protein
MATGPAIPVRQNRLMLPRPKVRNAAHGEKPGSFYLAAARSRAERDYVPTDVWNELP